METKAQALAVSMANYVGRERFSTHRGFGHLDDDHPESIFVYGNDGWTDDRAKEEIRLIRRHVAAKGGEEIAFGVCDDGYSWAMLVNLDDQVGLDKAITDAAAEAGFGNAYLQAALVH